MINFLDKCLKNVSLKHYCTFKIGGNAKYLFIAKTKQELIEACIYCKQKNIKFRVIGMGANLLFDDTGFDGMVIVNNSKSLLFKNNNVYANSGVPVSTLIGKCYQRSLSGLENLSGIPATVGGAVVNNLGAFDHSISENIEYVECFNLDNFESKKLSNAECKFGYRTSIFKNTDLIITKIKLTLSTAPKPLIQQKITEALNKKSSTQPLTYPSAGSIFKRGTIIPAKAIDELGLKGTTIGGAQISNKHAGFIINTGNATSKDVEKLINLVKERVKKRHNVDLEEEIEFIK